MAFEHEHFGAGPTHGEVAHPLPRQMPSVLTAPDIILRWRTIALIVAVVLGLLSLAFFLWTPEGRNHLLRSYLMGVMTCFNFTGGALALLLVQYLSGGKWGHVLRRPLEAMTRTIWIVVLMMLPILFLMKHLYQWAAFHTRAQTWNAFQAGIITQEQELCINLKHYMLCPVSAWVQAILVLGFMAIVITLLNRWTLKSDRDPAAGSFLSFDRWRTMFENLSGPSLLLYVIAMTDFVIVFIKSLDVTWYSSIYGLQLLVAQGYAVLALGILTLILLSRYEPMKSMFRITEQHDLGKLAFAFVMLNIYLTFAEFLIIWSGNVPDEIPWYLHRIRGGWWVICTLDVVCHWIIPFCILLSRDFKRSRKKMIWLCVFMIGARLIDMFWLIEPNFRDAAENLHITGNVGILAYITVPLAVVAFWLVFYLTELTRRPLIHVNDPHTEELLEPEHAH
ncbi:MAG TPA: hypothetical protein VMD97_02525 [Candidatus Aquilonibacter sp.]|nr:hypothetical protein [Candidatus Aquilonibacter sp.]